MKKALSPRSFLLLNLVIPLVVLSVAPLSDSYAADATWKADAGNNAFRSTEGVNWEGSGDPPGGVTDNPNAFSTNDVAYFSYQSTIQDILLPTPLSNERNIVGRFIFTAGSGAYSFSGGLLRIDSGSVAGVPVAGIYIESGVTTSQTFTNSIEFVGGSPYLSNSSTSPLATLNFKNIQGVVKSSNANMNLQLQGVNTGSNRISGTISQLGRVVNIVKTGAGMWVLSGSNTYTGSTTINGGTLMIDGEGRVNTTSGVTVDGTGATLRYDSTVGLSKAIILGSSGGTVLYNSAAKYTGAALSINSDKATIGGNGALNNLTISNGGKLTPGPLGTDSIGTLTVDSLVLNAGADVTFDIGSRLSFDSVTSVGSIKFGGELTLSVSSLLDNQSALSLFTASSYSENFETIMVTGAYEGMFTAVDGLLQFTTETHQLLTFNHQAGVLTVATIPEPSSIALLGGGFLLARTFGVVRRRPKSTGSQG